MIFWKSQVLGNFPPHETENFDLLSGEQPNLFTKICMSNYFAQKKKKNISISLIFKWRLGRKKRFLPKFFPQTSYTYSGEIGVNNFEQS